MPLAHLSCSNLPRCRSGILQALIAAVPREMDEDGVPRRLFGAPLPSGKFCYPAIRAGPSRSRRSSALKCSLGEVVFARIPDHQRMANQSLWRSARCSGFTRISGWSMAFTLTSEWLRGAFAAFGHCATNAIARVHRSGGVTRPHP